MGRRPRTAARSAALASFACAALLFGGAAQASDRPYLITSTAAAEEDDDDVWSVETWAQFGRHGQVLNVAPEYAFSPTTSVQLELSAGSHRSYAAEAELKQLFNHIARDGWGWGAHLTLGAGSADGSGWKTDGAALKLLYSVELFDRDALLHVNAGMQKQRDEQREWLGSLAFEYKLPWRSIAFAEIGREDRATLLHAGVRHWIRREKFALDFSVQNLRGGEARGTGVVIGLAWYDL